MLCWAGNELKEGGREEKREGGRGEGRACEPSKDALFLRRPHLSHQTTTTSRGILVHERRICAGLARCRFVFSLMFGDSVALLSLPPLPALTLINRPSSPSPRQGQAPARAHRPPNTAGGRWTELGFYQSCEALGFLLHRRIKRVVDTLALPGLIPTLHRPKQAQAKRSHSSPLPLPLPFLYRQTHKTSKSKKGCSNRARPTA